MIGEANGLHRVYVLVDSRDSEIFYVGMTRNPQSRVESHSWDAYNWRRKHAYGRRGRWSISNEAKAQRINEIHDDGERVIFKVVARFRLRQAAQNYETDLINLLSRDPLRAALVLSGVDPFAARLDSPLTNVTGNPRYDFRRRAYT